MNKFSNTSRYIYAILSGLPIGIILLVFGIKGLTLTENKLHKETGIVKELRMEKIDLFLELKDSKTKYNTAISSHISIITENIIIGDTITIYKIKGRNELSYIEKVEKGGVVLVEFNKAPLVPAISLILGIIIVVAGIYYLIFNFSDLFGGDKEKMEEFLDPWKKYKE